MPDREEQELARWFRDHSLFVWRVLRRLGLDAQSAEDAMQDVFMVVHRRMAEFDPNRGSARAWLFAIARRVAAHSRRADSRRALRLRSVPEPAAPPSPEELASRRRAAALVNDALERLDEPHRMVVYLAQIEEMTAPEIAAATGLPLNTVYSRIRNGRKKLARVLEKLDGEDEGGAHGS